MSVLSVLMVLVVLAVLAVLVVEEEAEVEHEVSTGTSNPVQSKKDPLPIVDSTMFIHSPTKQKARGPTSGVPPLVGLETTAENRVPSANRHTAMPTGRAHKCTRHT